MLCIRKVIFSERLKLPVTPILNIRLSHQLSKLSNENPQYPPIVDMSKEGQERHGRQIWYNSIKAMPTVEEKLYDLVVRQLLKSKQISLSSVPCTYNATFFYQYITRTHMIKGLPDKLKEMQVDTELDEIKDTFNEALLNHYSDMWQSNAPRTLSDYLNEKDAGSKLVKKLVSQCFKKMAYRNEHILESTIQTHPRLCSYWWHGGFSSDENLVHERNQCLQFQDQPSFVIRTKNPLSPILRMDDPVCATADVPNFNFAAEVLGIPEKQEWLMSMPGFWPGDPHEFPLLLVQTSDRLNSLLHKTEKYNLRKIEDSFGIMTSFALLNAVSTYQGFTQFHKLTYPLVAQTIITNGQDWTFYVYQLNTNSFHEDFDKKDLRNICWSSGKHRLFDTIEDGQVKGINDEVYKLLIKFLLNTPEAREDSVLRPYLGVDQRDEEDAKNMRDFLRKMMSQAPDPNAFKDEIPTWVQIYKLHKDAPVSPYVRLE